MSNAGVKLLLVFGAGSSLGCAAHYNSGISLIYFFLFGFNIAALCYELTR